MASQTAAQSFVAVRPRVASARRSTVTRASAKPVAAGACPPCFGVASLRTLVEAGAALAPLQPCACAAAVHRSVAEGVCNGGVRRAAGVTSP